MARNEHFEFPATWAAARDLVAFDPIELVAAESVLVSLAVHIRDHKLRDLAVNDRSLEAYYDEFTFSQRMCTSPEDAKHMAIEVSYGPEPRTSSVNGQEARIYDGDPEADDDDALPPVVVWHAGEMFYMLAGRTLDADALLQLAEQAERAKREP